MSGARSTRAIVATGLRGIGSADVALVAIVLGAIVPGPAWTLAAFPLVAVLWTQTAYRGGELMNLRYLAAPLYGRELARAHALLALLRVGLAVALAAASVGLFEAARHFRGEAAFERLPALAPALLVTVLIAMSASARRGLQRWLYLALAVLAGCAIEGIGYPGVPFAFAAEWAAAGAIAFAALRGLGQTLARYDAID